MLTLITPNDTVMHFYDEDDLGNCITTKYVEFDSIGLFVCPDCQVERDVISRNNNLYTCIFMVRGIEVCRYCTYDLFEDLNPF